MLLSFNAENNLSLTNFTDKAMKACIWEIHGHKLVSHKARTRIQAPLHLSRVPNQCFLFSPEALKTVHKIGIWFYVTGKTNVSLDTAGIKFPGMSNLLPRSEKIIF